MGNLNENPAIQPVRAALWKRALVLFGSGGAGAFLVLALYPAVSEHSRHLTVQPISSAVASDGGQSISPAEARRQHLSGAKEAVHGMFVKDPYGCVYMFQYVAAQLSLTPVLDEHNQPVCAR